jgi:hypothetical protein
MRASESDWPHGRSLQTVVAASRTHTSVSPYIKSGRPMQQDFSRVRGRGHRNCNNSGKTGDRHERGIIKNTRESYRRCCTSAGWVARALALRLMHAERMWSHDACCRTAIAKAQRERTVRDGSGLSRATHTIAPALSDLLIEHQIRQMSPDLWR